MQQLLQLARKTIEAHFDNKDYNAPEGILKRYSKKQSSFVTLTINKELRGCIGSLYPNQPLYKDIQNNAISAAFQDPRFLPLTREEFNKVKIEISILSIPEKLSFSSPEELLKNINKSLGIIIKKGPYSATYLPQVWEDLPDKEQFLSSLCQKAGLPANYWKNNDLEVYTYKVNKVKEE